MRQTIALLVGRKAPRIRLPHAAVLPLAYAAEALARITGRTTRITLEGVRMARKRMFFSSDKAVRELDYRDRKSTRLNSSHLVISYAVFCLKKKTNLLYLK